MKLLAVFAGLSALLLGACAYALIAYWARQPRPLPVSAPAQSVASRPAFAPAQTSQPSSPPLRPVAASAPALIPGPVRWADTAARDLRQRRMQRMTATLRATDIPPEALRDELRQLAAHDQWPDALVAVDRLLEARPDDPDLLFERAAILLRLRRHVAAITTLNDVLAKQPTHARAWFNLAVAHQALGHIEDARRAWDRTLELQPTPAAYAQRGVLLLDVADWAAAAADFEAVLQSEPHAHAAVLNLSLAYWELDRSADARRLLADFLTGQPNHIPALNRLAAFTWAAAEAAPADAALRAQTADLCRRSLALDSHQPDMQSLLTDATAAAR